MIQHRFFNWCIAAVIAAAMAVVLDAPDPDPALTQQQRAQRLCGNGLPVSRDDGSIECCLYTKVTRCGVKK